MVPSGSYVVAVNPFVIGDGVNNAVMSGSGTGGLPAGWSTADIGATGMTGSASYQMERSPSVVRARTFGAPPIPSGLCTRFLLATGS